MDLHIDIETYSSEDIRDAGSYRYFESLDFEILMVAFSFGDGPIDITDLAAGETLPDQFINALHDPSIRKCAHNANFERNAFKAIGHDTPVAQWFCTMIKAAYCGLPLSLGKVSEALELGDDGKLASGKALIRYFCQPCKPTKTNGQRQRNLPEHDPKKWAEFKEYCQGDVRAERRIKQILSEHTIPDFELENYRVDQRINDRGIEVDLEFARNAIAIDETNTQLLHQQMQQLTGVDNPNSPSQLKDWISEQIGEPVKSIAAGKLAGIIKKAETSAVEQVVKLRKKSSKTSTSKYAAMLDCACADNRARGMFQFYGASRTGRWGGRLIQLQNLPRNYLADLKLARNLVLDCDYEGVSLFYGDVASILSQLIRTAFIPKTGHLFVVADFSAIEARVIAWLAKEEWRLEVFRGHGKIYEASASMMFDVPLEEITKGSPLRTKGKIAELALGYGGSVGAMSQMGAQDMGLSRPEIKEIVTRWRKKSPNIVNLWKDLEECAKIAVSKKRKVATRHRGIIFDYEGQAMTVQLPSGRKLFYHNPTFTTNKWGHPAIQYKGGRGWSDVDTYGGKLAENITQAVARDILALAIKKLDRAGFEIVMHVHDEAVCEVPIGKEQWALDQMCDIMGQDIDWAPGLPNSAEGYITEFYKKD